MRTVPSSLPFVPTRPARGPAPRIPWIAASLLPLALAFAVASTNAGVPGGPPTFSDPLTIDNTYWPFLVGVDKVFENQGGSAEVEVIEHFSTGTRTFLWNGTSVATRLFQEIESEDGELTEISNNYFAQADDGTVYYFGETVDIYEGGVVTGHDGSWLVGGPTDPLDPPETATALDPAVFMPADPEVGDTWKPEDLFPIVDETVLLRKTGVKVRVPADRFTGCIQVEESTLLNSGTETKWYAPGVGFIKSKEPGETLALEEIVL